MIKVDAWVHTVEDLEAGEFMECDIVEIDIAFANRYHLEEMFDALTPEQREVVRRTDERLRAIGLDAITRCGLLNAYRRLGDRAPAEKWWWHL